MRIQTGLSRLLVVVVFAAIALPGRAAAQPLSTAARRCVKTVDTGTATLAKTQASIALDCIKQVAGGRLGGTVEACIAADAKGKAAKRRLKVIGAEPLHCASGTLPEFAVPRLDGPYTPPSTPAGFDPELDELYAETTLTAVPQAVLVALRDAFGDPLDSGLVLASSNAARAACQARLAKAIVGCARTERQAVLSCRKKSLAKGAADAAALENACLTTGGVPASGFPDPHGKLLKSCGTAIAAVLASDCAGQIPAAVPGACATADDVGACLVDRVDCRVCQEANTAGGLARDCDLLDDGLDNASCSATVPECGNDLLDPDEQCDDGNLADGDCCSSTCQLEATACPAPSVVIDTPVHGSFSSAAQVSVSGHVLNVNANDAALTLNGVPLSVQPDKTFAATLTLDAARVFNPAFAHLIRQRDGAVTSDRVVVIAGAARGAAQAAPSGLALRLNDSAFDSIEPTLSALVPPIDLSSFLQPGTTLLSNVCYLPLGATCLGSIDLAIGSMPPPGIDGVGFDVDAQTGKLVASITIQNLVLPLTVTSVTGPALSCAIELHAPATVLAGNYDLSPLSSDPTQVDVVQLGDIAVTTPGLTSTTTCAGGLGGLVNGLIGPLFSQLIGTLGAPLNQVDANGNTPIAGALEGVFAGLDLGGVLGTGLGLAVQAPYSAISEDNAGITFLADLTATAITPASGAPTLPAYLHVAESVPSFTANTPVGATPFDVAMGFSTSAVNALLRAQTEQGLMQLSSTSADLGSGTAPLTAGALAAVLPQLAVLAPATPLTLRLVPTLAPVLTGGGALSGNLAELRVGQLRVEVVDNPGPGEAIVLAVAVDARFDTALTPSPAGLTFALSAPAAVDVVSGVLGNPLGADEAAVAALMPTLVGGLVPQLSSALGTIPIPAVVGTTAEVSRSPYYTAFAEFGSLL